MIRLPTASSLDRAMACPASCVLPATDAPSSAADRGTAIHAYLQMLTEVWTPEEALGETPSELHPLCRRIDISFYDATAAC